MKFASYACNGRYGVGLLTLNEDSLIPIPSLEGPSPDGMLRLIEDWDALREAIASEGGAPLPLADVTLLAPIPAPRRNIFCVGKNYVEHAKEFSRSGYDSGQTQVPAKPVFFTKATTAVVGQGAVIERHAQITSELDYEAELGVIIGRGGRSIARRDALDHVWGYTILNDVTARDVQRDHQQWFLGKSFDSFCPMGPWAVTAADLAVDALAISCYVNGEPRQSAKTSDLIFDVPELIEILSAGITLLPGDIIATGTPEGVGIGFAPPKFLASGDEVVVEISGLGVLTNTVGDAV